MSPEERASHAINEALTEIETVTMSSSQREGLMGTLVACYGHPAVAAIAKVRGFRNLARIARALGR